MQQTLQPRRILFSLIILAIAVVFVINFGPGSTGFNRAEQGQAGGPAAVVNGKEIPFAEFQRAYSMQLQYFRARGNPLPESLARQIGIPQQVLEQLVNTELLAQAAESRGLLPSDKELADVVRQNPDFQKDGKFDRQTYFQVVRDYYKKTPQDYEADVRRRMAAAKMLELVESGATVSDDEVRARYAKEGNQAKLVFARFLPSMYADKVPAPKPQDVDAWKKAHADQVKAYYEANRFLYQQPEQVRVRQLLVKAGADKAAARAQAEALKKELDGGKDFAQLARAKSQDPQSAAQGGDLGFKDRGSLPPAVADAAFGLEPGKVSGVVEGPEGFSVLKLEEKRAAQARPLADVEGEIARTLLVKEQARTLARAQADKALQQLKAGTALAKAFPPEKEGQPALLRFETEKRPEAVETDTFTAAGEAVPHLGPAPELVEATFGVDAPGPLDRLFEVGDGYVVAQVTERKKPSDAAFAEQKDALTTQARQAKQIELRDAFLRSLKKSGKVETNPELLAQATEG